MPERGKTLAGKTAIITGAAQGIGYAYAERLGQLGAIVVVADIDGEAAEAAVKRLRADGLEGWAATVDISKSQETAEVARQVVERQGAIDILVNNAGLYRGFTRSRADEIDLGEWQRMLDVNVSGTYYMCRAVIPQMRNQGSGKIVNQSSASGLACRGMSLHYSLTKAALVPLTKVLSRELAEYGVCVNAIAPGMIDTEATSGTFSEQERAAIIPMIPMRRAGTTDDLVGVLEFLCSAASDYLTGQTILVDGGVV